MVVCYFHVIGVSVFPVKADSPLTVDPDAVLPPAISLQSLEPVTRWDPEVFQAPCPMKVQKLTPRNPLDRTKPRHILIIEQHFGFGIAE